MDLAALDYLEKWDKSLMIIFCGFAPVLVLTQVMKQWGCHNIDVLDYCNSGDRIIHVLWGIFSGIFIKE